MEIHIFDKGWYAVLRTCYFFHRLISVLVLITFVFFAGQILGEFRMPLPLLLRTCLQGGSGSGKRRGTRTSQKFAVNFYIYDIFQIPQFYQFQIFYAHICDLTICDIMQLFVEKTTNTFFYLKI
jgi:hypothetical protein